MQESKHYCPYCGEIISILIDDSEAEQDYIEDCEVCCRPIRYQIAIDEFGDISVNALSENE